MLFQQGELINAFLAGLGGALGWGFADFFSIKAVKRQKYSEASATFTLYLTTSILLWIIVFITGESISPLSLTLTIKLTLFAVANVVAYLLFFHALRLGNLSTISTIFSTYAVGSAVISILFFGEQTSLFRILSLLIVFMGILGVSIQNASKLTIIKGWPYVLTAAIILSLFFPFWDSFLGQQEGWLFWVTIGDSLMVLIFGGYLATKKEKLFGFNKGSKIMILGGVANTIAVIATNWGFYNTSLTSIVVIMSSMIPLISAVLGYFILKEKLILIQYLGIFAILIGSAFLFSS